MDSRPGAADKVHQIHGTGIYFSSKPHNLDENASEALREIKKKGMDKLVVGDAFAMDPEKLPKGFFLSSASSYWKNVTNNMKNKNNTIWRSHGSCFGYGIEYHAFGDMSVKRTFVCHKGNRKTNLIIVAYNLVNENGNIKTDDVLLCHVFQSDNYDPSPSDRPFIVTIPNILGFQKKEVDSCMLQLEGLMNDPGSFKDFYELDETYSKCQAKGRNGKRGEIWEHFKEIKVIDPDGGVVLTLAICHHCSMAYQTGKWDSKKGSLTNNGTKTLKDHYRRCSDQHHIAGNPQGAHHQNS